MLICVGDGGVADGLAAALVVPLPLLDNTTVTTTPATTSATPTTTPAPPILRRFARAALCASCRSNLRFAASRRCWLVATHVLPDSTRCHTPGVAAVYWH